VTGCIISGVDILVFDCPPEQFDECVVQRPSPAVHADGNIEVKQNFGEVL